MTPVAQAVCLRIIGDHFPVQQRARRRIWSANFIFVSVDANNRRR
jgi:hypothetical protein